ncbi:MAG TPA: hypothetical protein VGQ96_02650 [Candidatus Eremiobacteraceae bacterium]|nr:hypothetical protein [Candidatus Eremiobacteraceae bacterium]
MIEPASFSSTALFSPNMPASAALAGAILQNQAWLAALEQREVDAPSVVTSVQANRLHGASHTPSPETIRSNLRALWVLSGRAELEVAIEASRDALAKIALHLVR